MSESETPASLDKLSAIAGGSDGYCGFGGSNGGSDPFDGAGRPAGGGAADGLAA